MATFAERTELELQPLKFGASRKVWGAFLEVWRHGQEEGIALYGCSPSQALRSSAEPIFWSVQAPASLAPPPAKRSTSWCARNERREWNASTRSYTKGWQRIERSNTMLQRAQSLVCSSMQA
jgi:hypothetical protein